MEKTCKNAENTNQALDVKKRQKVKNSGPLVQQEMALIKVMIQLYYRKNANQDAIGEEKMLAYAQKRLERCRFGEQKPTCQHCPIHCYQKDYRQQMKLIMRYAGPRMLFVHPVLTVQHAYRGLTRRGKL